MAPTTARILPCANVVVNVVDDKQLDSANDPHTRLVRVSTAVRAWFSRRAVRDAIMVFAVGCSLLSMLSIAHVSEPFDVESLDVDSAVHLGQIVLFLGAYVGCWVVLSRMSRWIDTAESSV